MVIVFSQNTVLVLYMKITSHDSTADLAYGYSHSFT